MSKPRIVYPPHTTQAQDQNFKLTNVKIKVNPVALPSKFRKPEGGVLQKQGPNTAALKVSDHDLLEQLELMISQLQYNVFHQKCASDKSLALKPKDLDAMLKTDFWKDCCNYTIHIAIAFARFLQRMRDTRPRVSFRLRNRNRCSDDNRDLELTSKEIDIEQVGACLHELGRLIKKHYDDSETKPGTEGQSMAFHNRKSVRHLSTSLPRSMPSGRFTNDELSQAYPRHRPQATTTKVLKDQLTNILSVLSRDKNSFPQETLDNISDSLEMPEVQVEPRTPEAQLPRQKLTRSFLDNFYNKRMQELFADSDFDWSSPSASEVEPESDSTARTPITISASASTTSLGSRSNTETTPAHKLTNIINISCAQPKNDTCNKVKKVAPNAGIQLPEVSKPVNILPRLGFRYGDNSV